MIDFSQINQEIDSNICDSPDFKFFFHLPNQLITSLEHKPYSVEYDQLQTIYLTAKSFKTKPEVKKYSPFIRNCFFEGERLLKFFKQYTKPMCR